jgi:hypothetical protein
LQNNRKTNQKQLSRSSSHILQDASLGIRQSPLGDKETDPTFGPSGKQLLLNCCEKNLLKKRFAADMISCLPISGYALMA